MTSGARGSGASDMDEMFPCEKWKDPAEAIIAPLSVQRTGGGYETDIPASPAVAVITARRRVLHATPPVISICLR